MAHWYRFGLMGWIKGCEGDKCKFVKENKDLKLEIIKLKEQLLQMNAIRKENQRLNSNWNELRKWIVNNKHNENTEERYLVVDYGTLLGKMSELKGVDKE